MRGLLLVFALFSVVRANVWLDQALLSQREGLKDITLELLALPCTHNSYNLDSKLPPVLVQYENLVLLQNKVTLHNQIYTMTQQLNMGIRHLAIDAHYIDPWGETYMCHGAPEAMELCPLIEAGTGLNCEAAVGLEDLGAHSGCSKYADKWDVGLQEIANWVNANPDEYLIIEVEDQVTWEPNANQTQFADPIVNLFGSKMLKKADLENWRSSTGRKWPTLNEMKTVFNKSIFLTGINSRFANVDMYVIDPESNLIYPNTNYVNFNPTNCDGIPPNFTTISGSDIKVVLDFLSFNVSDDGTKTVGNMHGYNIRQVVNCGFTPCMDNVDDNSLLEIVWSWQQGYSKISCHQDMCPVAESEGWTHTSCTQKPYQAACQSKTDPHSWVISLNSSPYSSASCPSGYTFSFPHTPIEYKALQIASSNTTVWLNISLTYNPDHPVCSYIPVTASQGISLHFSSLFVFFFCLFILVLNF